MNEHSTVQYQYPRCECHTCTLARLPQFERAMLQSQQKPYQQEVTSSNDEGGMSYCFHCNKLVPTEHAKRCANDSPLTETAPGSEQE